MRFLSSLIILLMTASCASFVEQHGPQKRPSAAYRYLDLTLDETFAEAGRWTAYDDGEFLRMGVDQGAYRIQLARRQYVWTQLPETHGDVVIEAEVRQVSDFHHNTYGIACRLDIANSGRGYYFLISGDGHYSIRWSDGRSLRAIVEAKPTEFINRGPASNRLRVVCVGDYLALWVNDRFVAEARDHRAREGAVGLSAVMNYDGKRMEVAFDWLKVWRATLDDGEA